MELGQIKLKMVEYRFGLWRRSGRMPANSDVRNTSRVRNRHESVHSAHSGTSYKLRLATNTSSGQKFHALDNNTYLKNKEDDGHTQKLEKGS